MSEEKINQEIEDLKRCFMCRKMFKRGDEVVEFFGALAHLDCFNKKMEENKKRREEDDDKD